MNDTNDMQYLKIAETYAEGYAEASEQTKAFIRGAVAAIATAAAISNGVSSEEYHKIADMTRKFYN